jgi:hypothetical protein
MVATINNEVASQLEEIVRLLDKPGSRVVRGRESESAAFYNTQQGGE